MERSGARPRACRIRTRDGWQLGCHHYPDQRGAARYGPVLLVHGLGANRYNLDSPHPDISVARYLHGRGHDVWVVELRGAGRSRQPGWPLRGKPQFDFDDHVHRDVPAFVRHVLDHTEASAVHWVGHSMGGMLAYAALEHYDEDLFRSVVTMASPAFTTLKHPHVDAAYKLRFLLKLFPWVRYRTMGKLASLSPWLLQEIVNGFSARKGQIEPAHLVYLARNALYDLPASLLEQFAEWYNSDGGFARGDGLLDYYDHLHRITTPMLIMAGADDVLIPISDVRSVFEAISSADKEFVICGTEQGYSTNYGHIDLVLGRQARVEIYPHISRWIESHPLR